MKYFYLAAGIILFLLGLISAVKSSKFGFGFYAYTLIGLGLVVLGVATIRKSRHTEIQSRTQSMVNRAAGARAVPMKKCPACGAEVEAASRACSICNYHFPVVYTLTVFSPFDVKNREGLIKYLMTRMNKPYEEISMQLERGMVFRYSTSEEMNRNKASFERIGCKVKAAEVLVNS